MKNSFKKMITIKDISIFTKIKQLVNINIIKPFVLRNQVKKIALNNHHFNQKIAYFQSNQNQIIYDFTKKQALTEWAPISDRQIGGDSQSQFYFQENQIKQQNCCRIKGKISTQDRDKLIKIPFIGITAIHRFTIQPLCYETIQIQLKSDGMPIHFQFFFKDFRIGEEVVHGKIVSKDTNWMTYQLPLPNFRFLDATVQQQQSFRKYMLGQLDHSGKLRIIDFSIRLFSSIDCERDVSLKSISFGRRIGFKNFLKTYKSPYFYIVKNKDQIREKEDQYQIMQGINTGDKMFFKKDKK